MDIDDHTKHEITKNGTTQNRGKMRATYLILFPFLHYNIYNRDLFMR